MSEIIVKQISAAIIDFFSSVMAALICIKMVRGTFFADVEKRFAMLVVNRFSTYFISDLVTPSKSLFPGGARYPLNRLEYITRCCCLHQYQPSLYRIATQRTRAYEDTHVCFGCTGAVDGL